MLRKGVIVFSIVLGCLCAFAQSHQAGVFNDGKGLLFKISGKGLKQPSYVLGSMHTIPGDFVWRLPQIENIIDSVKQIACESKSTVLFEGMVAEFDMTNPAYEDAMVKLLVQKYTLPNGMVESFYNDLTKEQQEKCKELLPSIGFSNRREWHSLLILSKSPKRYRNTLCKLFENEALYNVDTPIDAYIYDSIASKNNLAVYELDDEDMFGLKESAASLMDRMRGMSRKEMSEFTYNYIEMVAGLLISTAQNYKYYLAQDHKSLMATANLRNADQLLMKERNNRWMKKIPALIQKEPTFIVVGLMHLFDIGKNAGLLHQLQDMGYTIERVE